MLTAQNLTAQYGAMVALRPASFEVPTGACVALMGRNGMGKTTLIRALLGQATHQAEALVFDDHNLLKMRTSQRARLGLGYVPEGRRLFEDLTVEQNLIVAARGDAWSLDRIYAFLPRLSERRAQLSGTLSGGEKQMLAIGRALMTDPKLLILDEATEGLAPQIRADIWRLIEDLKAQGLSILLVDGRVNEVLPVADSILLINRGELVWQGSVDAFRADPGLQAQFLAV